ncbi:hypothetical protein SK128_019995 [Halocaridina rubra]|uniref:Uncharacterized protein n=1 Tax=Halocaridina rubra TaxID=373956 RepID=A0AAN8X8T9_HALRR
MSSQVCFPTWSRGMSQSTNRSNLSPSGQQLQQLPNRCYQYPPCISSPQNSFPNCAPQQQQSRPHGTLSGNPVHHYIGNTCKIPLSYYHGYLLLFGSYDMSLEYKGEFILPPPPKVFILTTSNDKEKLISYPPPRFITQYT